MKGSRTLALIIAVMFCSWAIEATAIENFTHEGFEGKYWDASNIPVTFYLDAEFSVEWQDALRRGFANWQQAPRTNFHFQADSTIAGHTVMYPPTADGYNVVSPVLADDSNYDSGMYGAIALTFNGLYDVNKHYYEVNILMNTHDYTFSNTEMVIPYDQMDTEAILTHEAGHVLCMNDIYNPGFPSYKDWMGDGNDLWTMYGVAGYGDYNKRFLQNYDKQGIAYIYPVTDVLLSKTPRSMTEAPHSWIFTPVNSYWTAVAVKTLAGATVDKDVAIYNDMDRALANSLSDPGLVDFVVSDHNHLPTGEVLWPRVLNSSEDPYLIELCHEQRKLTLSVPATVAISDPRSLIDVWDVFLEAGHGYRFTLDVVSGSVDMGQALYRSFGRPYMAGRTYASVLSDSNGVGGSETFDYIAPTDDWYGFLAFNNSAEATGPIGSYRVQVIDLGIASPTPTAATETPTYTATRTYTETRTPTIDVGVALGQAVDNFVLPFFTGGNQGCVIDGSLPACGTECVSTGPINNVEASYLKTIVSGPGNLIFQWMVSGQPGLDYFSLFIDGSRAMRISGETTWQPVTINLSAGSHVIHWSFERYSTGSAGGEVGRIDCVDFIAAVVSPTTTPTPAGSLAEAVDNYDLQFSTTADQPWIYQTSASWFGGDSARISNTRDYSRSSLMTSIMGPGILSFYWQCSSEKDYDILWLEVDGARTDAISGAVNWRQNSVTLTAGPHRIDWTYEKDTNNKWGQDSAWVDLIVFTPFRVTPTITPTMISLPEAVDDLTRTYPTGGDASWWGQNAVYQYDGDSAQAGVIGDSQQSWFEETYSGPCYLSFEWKTSSELADTLCLAMDSVDQMCLGGETHWVPVALAIPAGAHIIRWTYQKDGANSKGQDTAWVDHVLVATATMTYTPTVTRTPTFTQTLSMTPTASSSPTPTMTGTATHTHTPSATCTSTNTKTYTWTPSFTPTPTVTPSPTYTATLTVTLSPTATGTFSPTVTPKGVRVTEPIVYPNPWNGIGPVEVALPLDWDVQDLELRVYTTSLRCIARRNYRSIKRDHPVIEYDGRDNEGKPLANGLYYLQVDLSGSRKICKWIILR